MTQIGIVAALLPELAPLIKRYGLKKQSEGAVYSGEVLLPAQEAAASRSVRLYVAACGMGSAAATTAFSQVLEAARVNGMPLDAILSFGWAGAISCGVKPPEAFAVAEVIEARTGEGFLTNDTDPETGTALRLVTLDHVARIDEKRPLAERYKAVLVDMEAATIARLARAHNLRFGCMKGISDGYTDVLPDFNRFLDRRGQLRMAAFVAHALVRPRYWPGLSRMGRHSKAAAAALAGLVPRWLTHAGLVS